MAQEASFQDLRAVGAFLVSAKCGQGRVEWIRVRAEAGGPLRIINPWPGEVEMKRGDATSVMSGQLLEIETKPGEVVCFRAK
jgi:hypothetical protein